MRNKKSAYLLVITLPNRMNGDETDNAQFGDSAAAARYTRVSSQYWKRKLRNYFNSKGMH